MSHVGFLTEESDLNTKKIIDFIEQQPDNEQIKDKLAKNPEAQKAAEKMKSLLQSAGQSTNENEMTEVALGEAWLQFAHSVTMAGLDIKQALSKIGLSPSIAALGLASLAIVNHPNNPELANDMLAMGKAILKNDTDRAMGTATEIGVDMMNESSRGLTDYIAEMVMELLEDDAEDTPVEPENTQDSSGDTPEDQNTEEPDKNQPDSESDSAMKIINALLDEIRGKDNAAKVGAELKAKGDKRLETILGAIDSLGGKDKVIDALNKNNDKPGATALEQFLSGTSSALSSDETEIVKKWYTANDPNGVFLKLLDDKEKEAFTGLFAILLEGKVISENTFIDTIESSPIDKMQFLRALAKLGGEPAEIIKNALVKPEVAEAFITMIKYSKGEAQPETDATSSTGKLDIVAKTIASNAKKVNQDIEDLKPEEIAEIVDAVIKETLPKLNNDEVREKIKQKTLELLQPTKSDDTSKEIQTMLDGLDVAKISYSTEQVQAIQSVYTAVQEYMATLQEAEYRPTTKDVTGTDKGEMVAKQEPKGEIANDPLLAFLFGFVQDDDKTVELFKKIEPVNRQAFKKLLADPGAKEILENGFKGIKSSKPSPAGEREPGENKGIGEFDPQAVKDALIVFIGSHSSDLEPNTKEPQPQRRPNFYYPHDNKLTTQGQILHKLYAPLRSILKLDPEKLDREIRAFNDESQTAPDADASVDKLQEAKMDPRRVGPENFISLRNQLEDTKEVVQLYSQIAGAGGEAEKPVTLLYRKFSAAIGGDARDPKKVLYKLVLPNVVNLANALAARVEYELKKAEYQPQAKEEQPSQQNEALLKEEASYEETVNRVEKAYLGVSDAGPRLFDILNTYDAKDLKLMQDVRIASEKIYSYLKDIKEFFPLVSPFKSELHGSDGFDEAKRVLDTLMKTVTRALVPVSTYGSFGEMKTESLKPILKALDTIVSEIQRVFAGKFDERPSYNDESTEEEFNAPQSKDRPEMEEPGGEEGEEEQQQAKAQLDDQTLQLIEDVEVQLQTYETFYDTLKMFMVAKSSGVGVKGGEIQKLLGFLQQTNAGKMRKGQQQASRIKAKLKTYGRKFDRFMNRTIEKAKDPRSLRTKFSSLERLYSDVFNKSSKMNEVQMPEETVKLMGEVYSLISEYLVLYEGLRFIIQDLIKKAPEEIMKQRSIIALYKRDLGLKARELNNKIKEEYKEGQTVGDLLIQSLEGATFSSAGDVKKIVDDHKKYYETLAQVRNKLDDVENYKQLTQLIDLSRQALENPPTLNESLDDQVNKYIQSLDKYLSVYNNLLNLSKGEEPDVKDLEQIKIDYDTAFSDILELNKLVLAGKKIAGINMPTSPLAAVFKANDLESLKKAYEEAALRPELKDKMSNDPKTTVAQALEAMDLYITHQGKGGMKFLKDISNLGSEDAAIRKHVRDVLESEIASSNQDVFSQELEDKIVDVINQNPEFIDNIKKAESPSERKQEFQTSTGDLMDILANDETLDIKDDDPDIEKEVEAALDAEIDEFLADTIPPEAQEKIKSKLQQTQEENPEKDVDDVATEVEEEVLANKEEYGVEGVDEDKIAYVFDVMDPGDEEAANYNEEDIPVLVDSINKAASDNDHYTIRAWKGKDRKIFKLEQNTKSAHPSTHIPKDKEIYMELEGSAEEGDFLRSTSDGIQDNTSNEQFLKLVNLGLLVDAAGRRIPSAPPEFVDAIPGEEATPADIAAAGPNKPVKVAVKPAPPEREASDFDESLVNKLKPIIREMMRGNYG